MNMPASCVDFVFSIFNNFKKGINTIRFVDLMMILLCLINKDIV